MAKKTRRVKARLSEAQLIQPQAISDSIAPSAPAAETPSAGDADLTEYHYVVHDLRRIGILAGVILGGLVALSFIL
jgi:hypothetical protein